LRNLAGNVHWGEAAVATGRVTSGSIGPGQRVAGRARHFGKLAGEIMAIDRWAYSQDTVLLAERNAVLQKIAESQEWREYLPGL
jgi:hypothetical protein